MRRCSSVHGQLVCLALACLWVVAARAQQTPRTDPIEVAALNTILGRWGQKASPEWNISGEPCSGIAVDDTVIDDSPIINPGIKCDCSFNNRTVCHITKLRVYALDVVGQIPAELQNLTYLTNLNLMQNYLTGSLPAFIGELTALEYLYIDSCGLSGELPSTFSKLKNLKILWASDNDFTGKIPDYIGSLSNLETLRFQGNNFDGPIPARLSNLVKLTSMRIGDLVSESSSLAFVANMTSLDTLILRNCRIFDNLASVDFSIFENLTYLDLSFNSITGKVPPTLLNLSSLGFL